MEKEEKAFHNINILRRTDEKVRKYLQSEGRQTVYEKVSESGVGNCSGRRRRLIWKESGKSGKGL